MCGKTADIQIPVVKTPNCVWSYEEHPTPLGLYPLALLSIKFTSSMTTEPLPHDFFKLPSIPPPQPPYMWGPNHSHKTLHSWLVWGRQVWELQLPSYCCPPSGSKLWNVNITILCVRYAGKKYWCCLWWKPHKEIYRCGWDKLSKLFWECTHLPLKLWGTQPPTWLHKARLQASIVVLHPYGPRYKWYTKWAIPMAKTAGRVVTKGLLAQYVILHTCTYLHHQQLPGGWLLRG